MRVCGICAMIGQAVHRGTAAGGSAVTSEWVDKDAQYASAGDDPESLESLGGFKVCSVLLRFHVTCAF